MQSTAFSLDWLLSMDERQLTIRGRYDRISDVRDFITEAAQVAGLNAQAQHHCQIAVDEACTTIIEHGYGGEDGGEIEIRCSFPKAKRSSSSCAIRPAPSTQPISQKLMQPSHSTNVVLVGWGIYFMSKMMDEIGFKRENETNVLRLTKFQATSE